MDWGTISPKMTTNVSQSQYWELRGLSTDQDSTANDGCDAAAERPVQHNGQRLVDNDIAQQQRHENPMLSLVQQVQHSPRVLVLRLGRIALQDLQVNAVLSHQPDLVNLSVAPSSIEATYAIVKPAKTPPTKVNASDATAIIQSGVPPVSGPSSPPWASEVNGAAATVAYPMLRRRPAPRTPVRSPATPVNELDRAMTIAVVVVGCGCDPRRKKSSSCDDAMGGASNQEAANKMSSYVRVSGRVPPAETLVLQERAGQNGALAIGRCDRLQFLAIEENSFCHLH